MEAVLRLYQHLGGFSAWVTKSGCITGHVIKWIMEIERSVDLKESHLLMSASFYIQVAFGGFPVSILNEFFSSHFLSLKNHYGGGKEGTNLILTSTIYSKRRIEFSPRHIIPLDGVFLCSRAALSKTNTDVSFYSKLQRCC